MSTLTVRIPDELRKELQAYSEQFHRGLSDVVRDSLKQYLAAEELRTIRQSARPRAAAEGFLTDEDVFEAVS